MIHGVAMKKKTLLSLLLERNIFESSDQAKRFIMAGQVIVNNRRCDAAQDKFSDDAEIVIKHRKKHQWVSRGGVKLVHALEAYKLDVSNQIALDIGASTGGFTDVLLHHGCHKVYAVDVGYNELAWSLRDDARVEVLERTNARHLTSQHIPEPIDILVCDASFIRFQSVLDVPIKFLKKDGLLIGLIKPQFQVEPHEVGEKGIISDTALHKRCCDEVSHWLLKKQFLILGLVESPIKGYYGNTEFLIIGVKQEH